MPWRKDPNSWGLCIAMCLGWVAAAAGCREPQQPPQQQAPREAEQTAAPPGIALGGKAPSFELVDQHGKVRSLETLVADAAEADAVLALVFYRSADW